MADLTPDQIAARSFPTSFRGFSVDEVRAYLLELAEVVDDLLVERRRLEQRLAELGDAELRLEFETVAAEVGAVLEAANRAAEGMRERASADAARWRSEAMAEAEGERRRARTEAEQLRADAWTTGSELLAQAQREAARILDEAEKDSLRRLGEAEREAHRLLTTARREADELTRNARMEAERLIVDANARHDGIIETARRQAESAQERTRALEQRRDELKRELDSVKDALAAMEGELDVRRERMGLSSHQPEDVERPSGEWIPGETVRVVRAQQQASLLPSTPAVSPRDAQPQEMHSEIRVIPAHELARTERPEPPPVEAPPTEVVRQGEAAPSEPEEQPAVQSPLPEQPEPQPQVQPSSETEAEARTELAAAEDEDDPEDGEEEPDRFSELAGLFERLRTPERPEPSPPSRVSPSQSPAVDVTESPSHRAPPALTLDPFDLRERLLLPITNRALRNLKRQLTEEQNVALEELRIDESGWVPSEEEIRERLQPDLVVLVAESFGAGHAAVEEMVGERVPRPSSPQTDAAEVFAADLARELVHVLEEGRGSGMGSRQLGASVSRVFRAWRTDETERRVRNLSLDAFHRSMAASYPPGLRWMLSGRGCATCRAAAEGENTDRTPPAHPGCGCTLVPA